MTPGGSFGASIVPPGSFWVPFGVPRGPLELPRAHLGTLGSHLGTVWSVQFRAVLDAGSPGSPVASPVSS